MGTLLSILLLGLGFGLVIKGADFLVEGSSGLAKKYGVSELAIGLTVVAFGTSAPELAVNIQANDAIVFGNVIGSNNFNLLGILGIAGLITQLTVHRKTALIELPFSVLVLVLLFFLCNDGFSANPGILDLTDGIILVALFVVFLFYVFKTSKKEIITEVVSAAPRPIHIMLGMIVLGLVGLALGGKLVVENASTLARSAGISETMIGLTIVSLGTSLPELATSIVAAVKKKADLAVGNIIGSNLFNILLILGVSALIDDRDFQPYLGKDILLTALATLFLFLFLLFKPKKFVGRFESMVLLFGFIGYFIYVMNRELNWF